jgi:hypothetical protein
MRTCAFQLIISRLLHRNPARLNTFSNGVSAHLDGRGDDAVVGLRERRPGVLLDKAALQS